MPTRAPQPCLNAQCPNIRPCAIHDKQPRKRTRAGRYREGNTTSRGYGGDWQKVRAAYMAEHVVCEDCGRRKAQECHHIVPIKDAPHLRLEPTNLMALCRSCHQHIEKGA